MIKAIIFDFDGVIVESSRIKTRAFKKIFESSYPEKTEAIVGYHERNMGISRFVKFRHIYKKILKLPLTADEEAELGKKFSDMVLEEIIKAPFVDGAEEFIVKNQGKYMMFVASGTPDEEIRGIMKRRGISNFFIEIYGTPASKPEIIKTISEKYSLIKEEIVFVGDADSDMRAAEESGVNFIARVTTDNGQDLQNCKSKINDLTELDLVVKNMGVGT